MKEMKQLDMFELWIVGSLIPFRFLSHNRNGTKFLLNNSKMRAVRKNRKAKVKE